MVISKIFTVSAFDSNMILSETNPHQTATCLCRPKKQIFNFLPALLAKTNHYTVTNQLVKLKPQLIKEQLTEKYRDERRFWRSVAEFTFIEIVRSTHPSSTDKRIKNAE